MVSRSFCIEFFGSLKYRIISSSSKNILTLSLLICIPFSPCLIALAWNSSTVLNWSADSGHPCLIPDFRGNGFNFSPLSMMLAVSLSYITVSHSLQYSFSSLCACCFNNNMSWGSSILVKSVWCPGGFLYLDGQA
jgi:hypothetical protein